MADEQKPTGRRSYVDCLWPVCYLLSAALALACVFFGIKLAQFPAGNEAYHHFEACISFFGAGIIFALLGNGLRGRGGGGR